MDLRELVILVLGLTIVGVVVRGLLVALKARKSQLRLAIDKNIPKDIDLEAIELAELPSGGARVVRRSPDELHAANTESKADAPLNIPVSKPVPASPEILPLEFEESLETEGSEAPVEFEGAEESEESRESECPKETEELPEELPEELSEELSEELAEELPEDLPEEFPEEIATD